MARNTVSNYIINATGAVSAVQNITNKIVNYNSALNRLNQTQNQLNSTSNNARSGLNKIATSANAATKSVSALHRELTLVQNVAAATIVYRGISLLTASIRDGIEAAQDLQLRLGEVQTVSLEMSNNMLRTAKSTQQWSKEMIVLSNSFGIPVAQEAEAAYQALSNQVIKAGEATAFMADESKLAIVAVSTLDQSVSVTSTVINAYGKSASDAAKINATLFGLVDVGRVRLDELGASFGRSAVLAHTLGVSFEEQAGALALLTRLGLDADVANTLLTNVFNGLIKPSKEMSALLATWGVNSGEAAIATFGLAGVMKKLGEAIQSGKGDLTEIATLMEDIRAITGTAGLVKNLDGLTSSIERVSNGTDKFNKAFDIQMENLGVRGKVQLEKFKNFFLTTFGLPAQEILVKFAENMGGADKAASGITKTMRTLFIATTAWYTVSKTVGGISTMWQNNTAKIEANTRVIDTNKRAFVSAANEANKLIATSQRLARESRTADILAHTRTTALSSRPLAIASPDEVVRWEIAGAKAAEAGARANQLAAAAKKARQAASVGLAIAESQEIVLTKSLTASTWSLISAEAALSLGLTVAIAAIVELLVYWSSWESRLKSTVAELDALNTEKIRIELEKLSKALDKESEDFKRMSGDLVREYLTTVAELGALNNVLLKDVETKYAAIHKAMNAALKISTDSITDNIKALRKELSAAETATEKLDDALKKLETDKVDRDIAAKLRGKGDSTAAEILKIEATKTRNLATEALAAGDTELALEYFKKTDKLTEDALKRLEKVKEKAEEARREAAEKVKVGSVTIGTGGISIKDDDERLSISSGSRGRGRGRGGRLSASKTIPIIDTKDEAAVKAATSLIHEAEEKSLALEKLINKELEDRKILLKEAAAARAKEAEDIKAELDTAEENQDKFRITVAALDTFKPSKKEGIPASANIEELDALINDVKVQGKLAGASPESLNAALKEAYKLRIELNRKTEADITKDTLAEVSKRAAATEEILNKRKQENIDRQKNAASTSLNSTKDSQSLSTELENILSTSKEVGGKNRKDLIENALGVVKEIKGLEEDINKTRKNGGVVSEDQLNQLKIHYDLLKKELEVVQKLVLAAGGGKDSVLGNIGAALGFGRLSKDKEGKALLPTNKAQTLSEAAAAQAVKLEEARAAAAKANEVSDAKLLELVNKLKKAKEGLIDLERIGKEFAPLSVKDQKSLNDQLAIQLEYIKKINKELETEQERNAALRNAAAAGGSVGPGAAFGRVGIDAHLTPTATGESVMNRIASRQYAPLLRMMNHQAPTFGGGNQSFGDVTLNINLPEGSSSMHATQIAAQLTRLRRQGRWN